MIEKYVHEKRSNFSEKNRNPNREISVLIAVVLIRKHLIHKIKKQNFISSIFWLPWRSLSNAWQVNWLPAKSYLRSCPMLQVLKLNTGPKLPRPSPPLVEYNLLSFLQNFFLKKGPNLIKSVPSYSYKLYFSATKHQTVIRTRIIRLLSFN